MAKIVVLDGHTTNPGDLDWEGLKALGELSVYDRTPPGAVIKRAEAATILLTNKVVLNHTVLRQLPHLRFISVLATGYNVVDVPTAKAQGVVVSNVRGYATDSVAQHVFALILELWGKVAIHHESVVNGKWQQAADWSYTLSPTTQLAGKTIGIYGFGQIGKKVAAIALALGMNVSSHHKHPERDKTEGVTFLSFEEMLKQSDVVTLHAPLTPENTGIINAKSLAAMRPGALLINTGRGGLIVEKDLVAALENGTIGGAGLDVLSTEPPSTGNPLIGTPNCILTPHIAWASYEARQRLLAESVQNVKAFLAGNPRNVI